MLLVYLDGLGSRVNNHELNISFDPSLDYTRITRAASDGHIHAARVSKVLGLEGVLCKAIKVVRSGTLAVIDAFVGEDIDNCLFMQ